MNSSCLQRRRGLVLWTEKLSHRRIIAGGSMHNTGTYYLDDLDARMGSKLHTLEKGPGIVNGAG